MQPTIYLVLLVVELLGLAVAEPIPPSLSDNLKVDSHVFYTNPNESLHFKLAEYVAMEDGSIRMDVQNVTKQNDKGSTSSKLSFFKLMTKNISEESVDIIVVHNSENNYCGDTDTHKWPLRDFSRLLNVLTGPRYKLVESSRPDRMLLGPAGLLRLVYANSNSFTMFRRSRDVLTLQSLLCFSMRLEQWDESVGRVAELFVTVAVDESVSQKRGEYKSGTTLLSQAITDSRSHVHSIALAVLPDEKSEYFASMEALEPIELLSEIIRRGGRLSESFLVAYTLVQERSLSRHTGLNHLADEADDPFLMPAGLGCGSSLSIRPFYIRATQFSGQYEARDYWGQFFVAYDQASNHLRYDVIGKQKMIYALDGYFVTYVANDASRFDDERKARSRAMGAGSKTLPVNMTTGQYYDRAHCAQTSLISERGTDPWAMNALYNRQGLGSILGLGEKSKLMYLGRRQLPGSKDISQSEYHEPIVCQVFESETSLAQVPALLRMHLRLRPRESSRLTLVYYFVDELNSLTRTNLHNEQLQPFESMWLKRVELLSGNEASKFNIVFNVAQITFSKSSWSLETIGEDTRNRLNQLEDPVRTFDLLECWPERTQFQLDLVLEQQNEPEWTRSLGGSSAMPSQQLAMLEESLMNFVSRQIGSARSQINQFTLKPMVPNNYTNLLLRIRLTYLFSYTYKEKLLGWVGSYYPLVRKNQVQIVNIKSMALHHECSLDLATRTGGQYEFHMLFCPDYGCGLLLVEPSELNGPEDKGHLKNYHTVEQADQFSPKLDVYFEMCEVYLVSKFASRMHGLFSSDHWAQLAASNLNQAVMSLDTHQLHPESKELKTVPYRTRVTKVLLKSGAALHSTSQYDRTIVPGVCYTMQTRPIEGSSHTVLPYDGGEFRITQLLIDKHHSRAHCRRACSMIVHCETYSYNHAKRSCALSNINQQLLKDPDITFEALEQDDGCIIYSLDKLGLFKREPLLSTRRPVDLLGRQSGDSKFSIVQSDLGTCAELAHSSDWSMAKVPGQLGHFDYMRLQQLCVIRGVNQTEFKRQFGHAARFIGTKEDLAAGNDGEQNDYSKPEFYETYERDLQQLYSRKFNYFIELTGTNIPHGALIERNTYNFDQCLQACSIRERTCVMFDFCMGITDNHLTKECQLFAIRSPFALNQLVPGINRKGSQRAPDHNSSSTEQRLTPTEEEFYSGRESSRSRLLVRRKEGCQHYYLTGDNLYVKRLLTQLPVDSTADHSAQPSPTGTISESTNPNLSLVAQTLSGLVIGIGMFIVQPTIVNLLATMRFAPRRRTDSQFELNEILDAAD